MPKFLILDRAAFEGAIQAEVDAAKAEDAIQEVDDTVGLPNRVIILGANAGKVFTVVEDVEDEDEVVVRKRKPVDTRAPQLPLLPAVEQRK